MKSPGLGAVAEATFAIGGAPIEFAAAADEETGAVRGRGSTGGTRTADGAESGALVADAA
jgi:hypothetical protein